MRVFKLLIRIVKVVIIFVLLSIIIPSFFMYRDIKPPKYVKQEELNFEKVINDELENLFSPDNKSNELKISFDEDFINAQIYDMLVESLKENLTTNPNFIANFDDMFYLKGVWVTYSKNTISINLGLNITYKGFTYKTSLTGSLKIVRTSTKEIVLKISKLSVGYMPYKWVARVGPELLRLITNQSLNMVLEDALGDVLTFDDKRQEFKINITRFLETRIENNEMIIGILESLAVDDFFIIDVSKDNSKYLLNISLNLNPIVSTKKDYVLSEKDKIHTEDELNELIESKMLKALIKQSMDFNSTELTALIDYLLLGNLKDNEYLIDINFYLDYQIKVLKPYFEVGSTAKLNLPILIGKENKYIKSNISLDIKFIKSENDLKLNFSNVSLGMINIDNETLKLILTFIELEEFKLDGSSFIIKDFFSLIQTEEIKISHINVSNKNVNIHFEKAKPLEVLDDIITNIPNAEVKDIARSILDKLENNENIDEDIDELVNIFENMTEEEKSDFYDLIKDYIKDLEGFKIE